MNDYDEDGNNIVPCPICLDVHCISKEDGKCPEEDEFVKSLKPPMNTQNKENNQSKEKKSKCCNAPAINGQDIDGDIEFECSNCHIWNCDLVENTPPVEQEEYSLGFTNPDGTRQEISKMHKIANQSIEKECNCKMVNDDITNEDCKMHQPADQSNTIGNKIINWEVLFDIKFVKSFVTKVGAYVSVFSIKSKPNQVKRFIKTLLSQATQEAKQQGYDEAVKMCVEKMEGGGYKEIDITDEKTGWRKKGKSGAYEHYTDGFTARWHNEILQDIINELQTNPDGK